MTKISMAACVLLSVVSAWAAGPFGDDIGTPRAPSVTVAPGAIVAVAPGRAARVALDFRVQQGYHINSNRPHNDLLVPTMLKLSPPTNIMVGKVRYPPGRNLTFAFLPDERLNVYSGDFSITALVTPVQSVTAGTYRVHGALKYQACDNRQCYPPKEVPVYFDVRVRKAARAHIRRNPGQSPHVHR